MAAKVVMRDNNNTYILIDLPMIISKKDLTTEVTGITQLDNKVVLACTLQTHMSQLFEKDYITILNDHSSDLTKEVLIKKVLMPFYDYLKTHKLISHESPTLDFEAFIITKDTIFQMSKHFVIITLNTFAAFSTCEQVVYPYIPKSKTVSVYDFLNMLHARLYFNLNAINKHYAIYDIAKEDFVMYEENDYVNSSEKR